MPSAEIQQMPLEQLLPSPYNVRSVRTEARIAALAQSLAEDGQKEPITVYLGNDGESLILSGVTRYLAAQSLGWEMLDARVVVLGSASSPLAVVKASRLHNDTQRETDLDHALRAFPDRRCSANRNFLCMIRRMRVRSTSRLDSGIQQLPLAQLLEGAAGCVK